jgi:N-acetylglucosamine malate deacetylase 2
MSDEILPTRKDFLVAMTGAAWLPQAAAAQSSGRKLLMVAAHPDDEYAFAAATYRLVREAGWVADQVVVTNGESGYRYASLAETYYGVSFAPNSEGRARLAETRKKEARNAGKVLGIRHHYFLDQKDLGFETDAASASSSNWDRASLRTFLSGLLIRERYDAIFTLLPTAQTHGHHRAATLLALEAVARYPGVRPLIFGVDPRGEQEPPLAFVGLPGEPLTRTVLETPALVFDRDAAFGYRNSLNYRIVVNWLIAEHKSQGLFQNDYGKHRFEQFWLFEVSGKDALSGVSELRTLFEGHRAESLAARCVAVGGGGTGLPIGSLPGALAPEPASNRAYDAGVSSGAARP